MLTENQIRVLFTKLNNLYFDGCLPQPNKIEFKFVKCYLGQFHWDGRFLDDNSSCVIRFSTAWEMTDFEVEQVLIHEMVHEWQWVRGEKNGHGRNFKYKAAQINNATNNKYKIARCTNIANKVCLKDRKKDAFKGVAIVYNRTSHPGKYMVAITSKRSVGKIMKWFPNCNEVSNVHVYTASGSIYNKFRKSVKIVHGYPYDSVAYCLDIAKTLGNEIKF